MFLKQQVSEAKFQIVPPTTWPSPSLSLNIASSSTDDDISIKKIINCNYVPTEGDLPEIDPSDFNIYLNYEAEKQIGKNNYKPLKNFCGNGDSDETVINNCEIDIGNISSLESSVPGLCDNGRNVKNLSIPNNISFAAPGSNNFQMTVNNGVIADDVANTGENVFSVTTPCVSANTELLNEYQDGSLFSIDFMLENGEVGNNFTTDSTSSLIGCNSELSLQQFNNEDTSTNDIDNIIRNEIIKLNLLENEKEVTTHCPGHGRSVEGIKNNCSDNLSVIERKKSLENNCLSHQHLNKIENSKFITNPALVRQNINNKNSCKGKEVVESISSAKDGKLIGDLKLNRSTDENLELGMEIVKENIIFDKYFFNNYCSLREKMNKEYLSNDKNVEIPKKDDSRINMMSVFNVSNDNCRSKNNIIDKNELENRLNHKSYRRDNNNKNFNEIERLLKGYKNAKYILLNKILLPVNKSVLNLNNNKKINLIKLNFNSNKKENVECNSNESYNNLIPINVDNMQLNLDENVTERKKVDETFVKPGQVDSMQLNLDKNVTKQKNIDETFVKAGQIDSQKHLANSENKNFEVNSIPAVTDNIVANLEKRNTVPGQFNKDYRNVLLHSNKISIDKETKTEKYVYNNSNSLGKDSFGMKCDLELNKDDNNNNDNAQKSDVSYVCLKCKIKINDKLVYKIHLKNCTFIKSKMKTNTNLEKCKVCGKSFKFKQSLNRHTKIVHGSVKPFTCLICDKKFTRKSSLDLHELLHKGVKNEICRICGDKFTAKRNLKSHLLLVHNVKDNYEINETEIRPFVCDICGKGFKQNKNLKEHKMTHSNKLLFSRIPQISNKQVQQREKNYKKFDKQPLQVYNKTNDNKYECLLCNKFYKRSTYLKHFSRKHRKKVQSETKFTCNDCDRTFDKRIEIILHINKMHFNENGNKQFKCEKCDKKFKLKSSLNNHFVVHDEKNNRPFKCDKCLKTFQLRSVLYRHRIVHSDVKKFKCSDCDKCYSYKHNLKKHIEKMKHTMQCVGKVPEPLL